MASATQLYSPADYAFVANGFARTLIADVLGEVAYAAEPHAMLVDDLGADSLDLVDIQSLLEEKDVGAPDAAFHLGVTVADIGKLILDRWGPSMCRACDGSGEVIFNNSLSQDPINDKGHPCNTCEGSGKAPQHDMHPEQVPA